MKTNYGSRFGMLGCLLLVVGCLGSSPEQAAPDQSAREALVGAIDAQATHLVAAINQVILKGDFLAQAAPDHSHDPIPLESDEDVKRAVQYLLSNGSSNGAGVWTYTPDGRFCTELVAKNDPSDCVRLLGDVRIVQQVLSASSGVVQMQIFGRSPLELGYSAGGIEITADLSEVLIVLNEENTRLVQNGRRGIEELPSRAEGRLRVSIASPNIASASFSLEVERALEISGTNRDGSAYRLSMPASQGLASVTLNGLTRKGSLSLNVPAFDLEFPIQDGQGLSHRVAVAFPGLTGTLSLDDAAREFSITGLRFTSPSLAVEIDGTSVGQVLASAELNAKAIPSAGRFALTVQNAYELQANVAGFPGIIDGQGTINLSVDAASRFQGIGGEQVEVTAGRIQLHGTGDFQVSIDASAPSCLGGSNGVPEVVVCTP